MKEGRIADIKADFDTGVSSRQLEYEDAEVVSLKIGGTGYGASLICSRERPAETIPAAFFKSWLRR
jgi:hypothetical protein